jgi:ATP-dependent DNA helicase RecQ
MGIDIPDIRGVVHYLITESTEAYYQQIGRVGRDGKPSWAVLFYSDKNVEVRRKDFIEKSFPAEKDIRDAFITLSDGRTGRRTVNYFQEGESTQSGYHYLLRSEAVAFVCKGIESLAVFRPKKNVTLPEFTAIRSVTKTGQLLPTAQKLGISEAEILQKIFRWMAEGKLEATRSPGKCLVIDARTDTLSDEFVAAILADVEVKKRYRVNMFRQFVEILESYSNSTELHMRVGEHLGIDRFSCERKHQTLSGDLVRSKSEVIIANILHERHIPFAYECPLFAPDGSWRLPDFTIDWQGQTYYWEHLGMLNRDDYEQDWAVKEAWYQRFFPGHLIITRESGSLSRVSEQLIARHFS